MSLVQPVRGTEVGRCFKDLKPLVIDVIDDMPTEGIAKTTTESNVVDYNDID